MTADPFAAACRDAVAEVPMPMPDGWLMDEQLWAAVLHAVRDRDARIGAKMAAACKTYATGVLCEALPPIVYDATLAAFRKAAGP